MAKNRGFFDIRNVVITLKSWVTGLLPGLVMGLLVFLQNIAPAISTKIILFVLMVVAFIIQLFWWGYLANKWWKWQ